MPEDGQQKFDKLIQSFHDKYERRYEEFLKLTLAASYGALLFLLQIEKFFPKGCREFPFLLYLSWILVFVAAIVGSLYMILYMILPLAFAIRGTEALEHLKILPEQEKATFAESPDLKMRALVVLSKNHLRYTSFSFDFIFDNIGNLYVEKPLNQSP